MSDFDVAEERVSENVAKSLCLEVGGKQIYQSVGQEVDLKSADVAAVDYCIRREIFRFIKYNAQPESKDFNAKLSNMMRNLFYIEVMASKAGNKMS